MAKDNLKFEQLETASKKKKIIYRWIYF